MVNGLYDEPKLPNSKDATPLSVAVSRHFVERFLLLQGVTVDWAPGLEYPPEKVKGATNADYRKFAEPGQPITWLSAFRVFEKQITDELQARIAARQSKTEQPKAK